MQKLEETCETLTMLVETMHKKSDLIKAASKLEEKLHVTLYTNNRAF